MPELLVYSLLWITGNQKKNIVFNFHQDFVANSKSNFF